METLESVDAVIEKYSRQTTPIRKWIYVAIGSIFVGCAFIGLFVPGWPTVSWMVPAASVSYTHLTLPTKRIV